MPSRVGFPLCKQPESDSSCLHDVKRFAPCWFLHIKTTGADFSWPAGIPIKSHLSPLPFCMKRRPQPLGGARVWHVEDSARIPVMSYLKVLKWKMICKIPRQQLPAWVDNSHRNGLALWLYVRQLLIGWVIIWGPRTVLACQMCQVQSSGFLAKSFSGGRWWERTITRDHGELLPVWSIDDTV